MGKQNTHTHTHTHTHTGTLLSPKTEGNPAIYNMDKPRGHYAK